MRDLISREATKKAINDYFISLIEKGINEIDVVDCNAWICRWIIGEQPTAYDVEAVIGQLEVVRENRQYDAERCLYNRQELMEYGYNCEISGIDKAIYIIKGGGQ